MVDMQKERTPGYLFFITVMFILASFQTASALSGDDDKDPEKKNNQEEMAPGWVLVKFKEGVSASWGASKTGVGSLDAIGEKFGVQSVIKIASPLDNLTAAKKSALKGVDRINRIYKLQFDAQFDPRVVAASFSKIPEIEYAEPLYLPKVSQVSGSAFMV